MHLHMGLLFYFALQLWHGCFSTMFSDFLVFFPRSFSLGSASKRLVFTLLSTILFSVQFLTFWRILVASLFAFCCCVLAVCFFRLDLQHDSTVLNLQQLIGWHNPLNCLVSSGFVCCVRCSLGSVHGSVFFPVK